MAMDGDWQPAVYILASQRNGTLYIGVASRIARRIFEHREGLVPGFTQKYGVKQLVYLELHGDIRDAILREKQLKKWNRAWKLRLIETENPQWRDLAEDLGYAPLPPGSPPSRG